MFLRPDNLVVIAPATFLFFWALSILGIKRSSLRKQKKAVSFALIPKDPQFSLNAETAQDVLTRLERTAENPDRYLLLRRIRLSLSNLNNIGQISDVSEMLRGEAEEDDARLDNSFSLIHSFVWAIPVLGFIGTAIGLSLAIGQFSGVLNSIGEVEQLQASLGQVTGGLGTAFETTLIGLFFALILHLISSIEEDEERRFLNECSVYCQEKIISRLKIRKD
jgi:biopolymer transport protein ExbB/TolQ